MAERGGQRQKGSVSPYICLRGAAEAIAFYKQAFGAEEDFRLSYPDGRVGHAQIYIYGQMLMLADEHPDFGVMAPPHFGGSPVTLHVSVDDADAATARAVEAGCTLLRTPREEFYGARVGQVACPYGYRWNLHQMVEEVAAEELQRRWTSMIASEA